MACRIKGNETEFYVPLRERPYTPKTEPVIVCLSEREIENAKALGDLTGLVTNDEPGPNQKSERPRCELATEGILGETAVSKFYNVPLRYKADGLHDGGHDVIFNGWLVQVKTRPWEDADLLIPGTDKMTADVFALVVPWPWPGQPENSSWRFAGVIQKETLLATATKAELTPGKGEDFIVYQSALSDPRQLYLRKGPQA